MTGKQVLRLRLTGEQHPTLGAINKADCKYFVVYLGAVLSVYDQHHWSIIFHDDPQL